MMTTITDPVVLAQISQLQTEIAALHSAIISGATRVSYDGRSVEYDDLLGMKQRLNFATTLLNSYLNPGKRKATVGLATFNKGYRINQLGYGGNRGF